MRTLLLFGAGASYGSGECHPEPPPLGKDLFDKLRESSDVAASIEPPLAKLFRKDFESGMAEFFQKRNVETTAFQREMALYFSQFEPGPTNHYVDLIRFISSKNIPVVFSTINYDLLIEIAAGIARRSITYNIPLVSDRNLPVLKLHGSCNFLPDIRSRAFHNIGFKVPKGGSILNATIRTVGSSEVRSFCETENSVAPALAMYAHGKQVLWCPRFVEEQQRQWKHEVQRSDQIILVGIRTNPLDDHIWDSLASTTANILYVGGSTDEFLEWSHSQRRHNDSHLRSHFEDAIPEIRKRILGSV